MWKLLYAGAAINAQDNQGETPIAHAVKSLNEKNVEHLIFLGARIGITNHEGNNILHLALLRLKEMPLVADEDQEDFLINIRAFSPSHETAKEILRLALWQAWKKMFFGEKGMHQFEARNNQGKTPLNLAEGIEDSLFSERTLDMILKYGVKNSCETELCNQKWKLYKDEEKLRSESKSKDEL